MLIDTHCHLNDEAFADDFEEVLQRARDSGVHGLVVPGVDVPSSERAIEMATRYDGVYAAVGIHPESLEDLRESVFDEVRALADHPKVVAIGEIGLDYHWDVAPRPFQQEVFARQMVLANELRLPIIVHDRESTADTVRLIEEAPDALTGVMHCFTGSLETATRCMNQGFYISYGGPLTFKNAPDVRETAVHIPTDRILVETDSPYLSPHPLRGKRNEPERVRLVAERLAEIRGTTVELIEQATQRNAARLFAKADFGAL